MPVIIHFKAVLDGIGAVWYNISILQGGLTMEKLNTFGQNVKKFVKDNLFPEKMRCIMCDIEIFDGELCSDCLKSLSFNDGEGCPKCGRKTAKSEICIECKAHMPPYNRAMSPLVYEGGSVELVGAFKNGRPYIAKYLSSLMVAKLQGIPRADGIVCVPMTDRALRVRGYNQSELLAKHLSMATGVPVLHRAVVKIKDTPAQKELTRVERLKNLQSCFKADKKQVKGKALIVIDDVMTTGATAESMAQTLKNAGACAVFVITAASVKYSRGFE